MPAAGNDNPESGHKPVPELALDHMQVRPPVAAARHTAARTQLAYSRSLARLPAARMGDPIASAAVQLIARLAGLCAGPANRSPETFSHPSNWTRVTIPLRSIESRLYLIASGASTPRTLRPEVITCFVAATSAKRACVATPSFDWINLKCGESLPRLHWAWNALANSYK